MNLVGECHGASPGPQGSIRMHVTVNNTIGQVNLFQDGAKRCTTSCHIQGFRKKCHSYVSRHVGTRGHIARLRTITASRKESHFQFDPGIQWIRITGDATGHLYVL